MKALTPLRLLTLPLLLLAAGTGCKENSQTQSDPEWWRLEGRRMELAHQVDLLKLRLSHTDSGAAERAAICREICENEVRIAELEETASELRGGLAELTARYQAEREGLVRRLRADAVGREFSTLAGAKGRIYEKVVVTRVTDIGVEFRHEHGHARLAAVDLTPEQHVLFGIDPLAAGRALEEERRIAAIQDDILGEQVLIARRAKEEAEKAAEERETDRMLASARSRSEAAEKRFADLGDTAPSRLREGPRSFGTRYWGGYTGSRYYLGNRSSRYSAYSSYSCYPSYTPRCGSGTATYRNPAERESPLPMSLRRRSGTP